MGHRAVYIIASNAKFLRAFWKPVTALGAEERLVSSPITPHVVVGSPD